MDDETFHDVDGLEYKVDHGAKKVFVKQIYIDPQGKESVTWRVTGGDYAQFMKSHGAVVSSVAPIQPTVSAVDLAALQPEPEEILH